eukprot:4714298-Ditylum_brightwellii.AAC.1
MPRGEEHAHEHLRCPLTLRVGPGSDHSYLIQAYKGAFRELGSLRQGVDFHLVCLEKWPKQIVLLLVWALLEVCVRTAGVSERQGTGAAV